MKTYLIGRTVTYKKYLKKCWSIRVLVSEWVRKKKREWIIEKEIESSNGGLLSEIEEEIEQIEKEIEEREKELKELKNKKEKIEELSEKIELSSEGFSREGSKRVGEVSFYHKRKQYGFIELENPTPEEEDKEDIFFNLTGEEHYEEGEKVKFHIVETERGRKAEALEKSS